MGCVWEHSFYFSETISLVIEIYKKKKDSIQKPSQLKILDYTKV